MQVGKPALQISFHHFILSVRLLRHDLPTVCRHWNGSSVGDHRHWTGTSLGAKYKREQGAPILSPAHSWPLLSHCKKSVFISGAYIISRAAVWRMLAGYMKFLDGECLQVPSHLLRRFCLCLCVNIRIRKTSIFKKTRPHYPQIPSRQPQAPTYSAHSHAVSEISVSHHQHRLFEVLPYVCVSVCVRVCVCELQPWRWHKFSRETPSVPKLSRKRKSPPLTPSTAHSLFPLSGTHWGTVLVSAPVTQHFPHSTVSLPIAFASPHFAGSFHLHEGNEPLPLKHKKKKKERYFPPPCTWCITDLLCLHLKQSMIQVFRFNMETRLFLISLTPPPASLFETYLLLTQKAGVLGTSSCCCHWLWFKEMCFESKRRKQKKKTTQEKKTVEQLYLTSSPSGKTAPPSRLTINKPLPSFIHPPSPRPRPGALHICEKVIISQSGAAGCHVAFSAGKRWEMLYVRSSLLLCCLNSNSIAMTFETALTF